LACALPLRLRWRLTASDTGRGYLIFLGVRLVSSKEEQEESSRSNELAAHFQVFW
jgi:hypothetical protein